ncbi:MAG: hypothetical protein D6775_10510 [Caldilineae bacterium]|nr:MAG: hypothetical protein D6775_10510 [Caldilineae bacterium]
MKRSQTLLIGALIGALLGLAIAWVASDARQKQELLLEEGKAARIRPRARDWVSLAVAGVSLVRQLAEMLEPRK